MEKWIQFTFPVKDFNFDTVEELFKAALKSMEGGAMPHELPSCDVDASDLFPNAWCTDCGAYFHDHEVIVRTTMPETRETPAEGFDECPRCGMVGTVEYSKR